MSNAYPSISGQFLINGEWVKGAKVTDVTNPASLTEVVGQVALCSKEDVQQAIDAAEQAFPAWASTPAAKRAELVKEASKHLAPIIEQTVPLFVRENGKPQVEAKKDIMRCVEIMSQGADALVKWWEPQSIPGGQMVQLRRRPRGVTAVISPWNSPMILTFKRVVPAILAGNTVVVKPATDCPLTVLATLKVVAEHLPPGVINIVTGSGALVGEQICADPRVRTIAFTGSTETGKRIMSMSAGTVKKLYMELGGNDPALILPDAVLDETAMTRIRMGILRAAGQVCSAIKRVYVHESRYEEFMSKLTREFGRMIVGNGMQPDAMMGPINNKAQYDYVTGLIERTKQAGAQVDTLGIKLDEESWGQGYFLLPSIATGLDQSSELVRAEQFGPVIPVLKYSDLDEAIAMANDTEFGLRASVWTADQSVAETFADRLDAGAVFFNNHTIFQDLHYDFPGLKESGLSRETQMCGIDLFADTYGFAN
ncbi:aldehyde dehydrogenase family protein [Brevibacillus centrosporus]|uniref:Acyl-CoA reductase n=1 Tax=Brevibacillus centrosporus TaxID=54910 RepID=A0A1I4CVF1_9BACL|nr:aldehyde dehydrogenase family protein [Brevibacillus centrosporus]MEC2132118.1 aldehyde dehydrogenase family protein [Brevibacillus centrosporus]MED4911934.1 aldehyde dehydrogenase family protein [Brevibacillus centrosporus]RNB68705.1 aldehyde dehydrogenase family protein [Brevibacillus centrosporus]SFK84187.1 Acyl-CoA reductase [Brevibacillus centrosporus]GED31688.1 aldehyde dehydrogenase [Brevibacillus centrosporus]